MDLAHGLALSLNRIQSVGRYLEGWPQVGYGYFDDYRPVGAQRRAQGFAKFLMSRQLDSPRAVNLG